MGRAKPHESNIEKLRHACNVSGGVENKNDKRWKFSVLDGVKWKNIVRYFITPGPDVAVDKTGKW